MDGKIRFPVSGLVTEYDDLIADEDQRQTDRLEHMLHELSAGLADAPLVAFIIEFYSYQGAAGLRAAQQKVHALAIDLVALDAELMGLCRFHFEQVPRPTLTLISACLAREWFIDRLS